MEKLSIEEINDLIKKSYANRINTIKLLSKGDGHIGGAFSSMDMLTVLYNKILKINPKDPNWDKRDVFLLSAAHKAVGLYVVLQSVGYFEQDIIWTYYDLNSKIPTHPDAELLCGIDFSFGSLGHGLSVGVGIALAFKRQKSSRRVFVLMGDGEACEGSVWEAAIAASTYKLDNLTAIIDVNKLACEDFIENQVNILPYEDKYRDFGWAVKTVDAHNIGQIYSTFKEVPFSKDKPNCIIANSVKAKGVSFCENSCSYHHWAPDEQGVKKAIESIKENLEKELKNVS